MNGNYIATKYGKLYGDEKNVNYMVANNGNLYSFEKRSNDKCFCSYDKCFCSYEKRICVAANNGPTQLRKTIRVTAKKTREIYSYEKTEKIVTDNKTFCSHANGFFVATKTEYFVATKKEHVAP